MKFLKSGLIAYTEEERIDREEQNAENDLIANFIAQINRLEARVTILEDKLNEN